MVTEISEKAQLQTKVGRSWPELKILPEKSFRVPLFQRSWQRIKLRGRVRPQLKENPPSTIWPRVMEAIEDFGLYQLYVYAPKEAFREYQADPAIIAEKNGRFYLVAVWGD